MITAEITPLINGNLFFIYDLEGRGVFVSPTLRWNIIENMDLTATVMTAVIIEKTEVLSDFAEFEGDPVVLLSAQYYF